MCIRLSPVAAALLVVGCLSPRAGMDSSTNVELTGESGSSGLSEPAMSTSMGGIMTTTEEPDEESSGSAAAASTADDTTSTSGEETTSEPIPEGCGNGVVEGTEECDAGEANADDGACTSTCKQAKCGDGHVHAGVEACDDAADNGAYNHCADDCMGDGPRCGDGEIQMGDGEECDDPTSPKSGCRRDSCQLAQSCLELKDSWADQALDGMYAIYPNGKMRQAYCDMTSDGGGYTFVKYAADEATGAAAAEAACGTIGLHLFIPRTTAHLASAAARAFDEAFKPGSGQNPQNPADYLRIFAIYPVTMGQSCVDQALNSEDCPQWKAADDAAYWVTGVKLVDGEPSTNNCLGCSMAYYWTGQDLTSFEALKGGGVGATATHFLCDVGDKRPMH
jgi:hypothetical protein